MSDTFEQRQFFANLELAKFQMAQKNEVQKANQHNRWKTIALFVYGIISLLVIFLGFIAWCVYIGKEQFVIDFLKYSLYPLSAGGGFWAGRISTTQKDHNFNPTQL